MARLVLKDDSETNVKHATGNLFRSAYTSWAYLRRMLTDKEEAFVKYWEANRERQGKLSYQLSTGLPLALFFGFTYWGIMELLVYLNYFPRAGMKYNSISTYGNTIITAIVIFGVFFSVFSKKFKWEKREEMYKEFVARKIKTTT